MLIYQNFPFQLGPSERIFFQSSRATGISQNSEGNSPIDNTWPNLEEFIVYFNGMNTFFFKFVCSYGVAPSDDTELDLLDDSGDEEGDTWDDEGADILNQNAQPMWVLPLYSILPSHKQAKVYPFSDWLNLFF